MSEINFSSLPWFVKRDIIDRVIYANPNYCLVGSEWLHSRSRQFSKLQFDQFPVRKIRPKALLTKYSEVIEFQRTGYIDWEKIYERDHIKKLIISSQNKEYEDFEFTEKLLKLQGLKHLIVQECFGKIDTKRILICYANSLKSISITMLKADCSTYVQGITFPNLISLHLVVDIDFFSSNNIIKHIPNLKRLYLRFCSTKTGNLVPDDVIVPNITHLGLEFKYDYDTQVQLDISRFPNVENLLLSGKLKLIDPKPCFNIIYLSLSDVGPYFTDFLLPTFYNIRKLCTLVDNDKDIIKLSKTMKFIPKLMYLHFKIDHHGLFFYFPSCSIKVNTLRIEGQFCIFPYLNWIFTSFNLEKLELEVETATPSESVPTSSETLKHVAIRTQDPILTKWYKDYFCKDFFPQLEILEFLPFFEATQLHEEF